MLDKNHPVYREFRALLEARLALHRTKIEVLTCPPEKTAELRGRIDEIKRLLDWNGEPDA